MIQQLFARGDQVAPRTGTAAEISLPALWVRILVTVLLLAILVLSPLLFASVLPRDRSLMAGLAFLAFAAAVIGSRDRPGRDRPGRDRPGRDRPGGTSAALALTGVGVYGLVQSLAWPAGLAAWLTPAADAWQTSRELIGAAGGGIPLSLAPAVSRSAALFWLAAAAAFVAASFLSHDRRSRRLLLLGFGAVTVFEIVYGADAFFEGRPKIWGRELLGGVDRLRGTFVNPDHFAMFLVLALAGTFAWGLWAARRARRGGRLEERLSHLLPPWLFFLMVFAALAFTGSRAGLLGGVLALFVQSLLLTVEHRRWQAALWGVGALALGMGGLLYLGIERGLGRFFGTTAYEITWNMRLEVYRASLELWRDFFWTGTGLGTFRQAFPRVQPADLPLEWFHAHSDVLELFITTGIVGPLLLGGGLVFLSRRLATNLRYGRRSEDRAVVLGAAGGLGGVLGHSLVDFGLTMPANALTLAILVGLACGIKTRPAK